MWAQASIGHPTAFRSAIQRQEARSRVLGSPKKSLY